MLLLERDMNDLHSKVVTRLLPEKCMNNIVIMREQHCWTNNIVEQ